MSEVKEPEREVKGLSVDDRYGPAHFSISGRLVFDAPRETERSRAESKKCIVFGSMRFVVWVWW
jgi:hypothetical protein